MKKLLSAISLAAVSLALLTPNFALAGSDQHEQSGSCHSTHNGDCTWERTSTYNAATHTKTTETVYTYSDGLTVTREMSESKDPSTGDHTRNSTTTFAMNGVTTDVLTLNETMVPVHGQPGNYTTSGGYSNGKGKTSTFTGTDNVTGPNSRYLTWNFIDNKGRTKYLTDTATSTDTEITNHYVGTGYRGESIDYTVRKKIKHESDGDFLIDNSDDDLFD